MEKVKEKVKDKVRKICISEMEHCIGKEGSALSRAREGLKRRYLGYGYQVDQDREERGFSTYIDRTLLEVVEWAKPGLFRVFASGDEIIRYEPKTMEQEQASKDATLYVNSVIFGRNMFKIVHDVLTDGLMQRVGWCIAHCPKRQKSRFMSYTGLSEEEALSLLMDPALSSELDDHKVEIQQYDTPYGPRFDLGIHQSVVTREIEIESIPSERVILSSDATDVESARFIAHWEIKTASELRKEGYKQSLIDELQGYDSADEMPETEAGRSLNAETHDNQDEYIAKENRRYKVYEAWTDCDINDDGIAEKVKVTFCGDSQACKVLNVEEWPFYRHPLFSACSVPLPHNAVGLCLADLVSDIQDLRTEITRQYLDNLALSNQGELVVSEGNSGEVEYDSLLSRGIGAVHRIRGDAEVKPLTVATSSADALAGLNSTDSIVERRTGISARTQSIKADTLQNTATGASIMEEAINQRLELIARIYAETFFRPLGRYLLHLVHRYQDKEIQVRLKGKYMTFNPRVWDPDMDISVAVGLGTSSQSRLLTNYMQILKIQQGFISLLQTNSPVRLRNIIYTCHKLVEAAGLEGADRFFNTEADADKAEMALKQSQSQGDPKINLEKQKLALQQQKLISDNNLKQSSAFADTQIKTGEAQAKIQLKQQETMNNMELKRIEMQNEKELDQAKILMGNRDAGSTNIRSPV